MNEYKIYRSHRKIFLSLPLIFLPFVLFFVSCNEKKSKQIESNELKFITSFPPIESEIYFDNPMSLAVGNNRIFVSDQLLSTIFVFDYKGNFIKKMGRVGRGPKEFIRQALIDYYKEKLFVMDQGNRRLSIWYLRKDSVDVHYFRDTFIWFEVGDNRIYAYNSNEVISKNEDNYDEEYVIQAYDWELNKIEKFGLYINDKGKLIPMKSAVALEIYKSTLYVLHKFYPILKKFTLDGDIISTKISATRI